MQLRSLLLVHLAGVLAVGCAGDTAEDAQPAAPAEPAQTAEPGETAAAPEAEFEALRAEYVRHYNLGHPEMVADLHAGDGVFLDADGSVMAGRDELVARMTADMESSPTLALETAETLPLGDDTMLGRGSWTLDVTAEGSESITRSGSWVNVVRLVDGEWKIALVATNDSAPAPAGTPADPDAETPPEIGAQNPALNALADEYARHFNDGEASMVAELFAENGVAMFAEAEPAAGRAAITRALEVTIAEGSPRLTIHPTGAQEIGNGWVVGVGWYEVETTMDGETVRRQGNFTSVNQPLDDGGFRLHWLISNVPNPGM